MAQNFTIAGAASIPLEDGGVPAPIDLAVSMVFLNRADFNRNYLAAVTDDEVDFGTLATGGAKGVLVKCKSGSAVIKFNSNTGIAWPLHPGGYFLWVDPSQAFPTTAFITTTGAASVVFVAVG